MKIAFFGDAKYVGAWEWMQFLAAQQDFDVHGIVFPGHERPIEKVTLHLLPRGMPEGKIRYFACVPALKRMLREIRPDILIAYRVVSYGFAAAMSGFHPLVLAAQGMMISSRATPRLTRFFARRAVRRADLLHAWAPVMAENMVALGADPSKILTLTRGVDDSLYTPGAEPPPPLTLVTTRQLERYYNFETLLRAVKLARDRVGEIRWLIAGQGSQRGELEAMAADMGIGGNVSFLGAVGRDRLPSVLRSAHLYVAAVPTDGTSMSLLEAMASGVVPIVADNDSNRHWVKDGETGRLLPPLDADGYARAIAEAWEDGAWRKRAGVLNREAIESRASWNTNMTVFAQAYRDLACSHRNPASAEP